MIIFLIVVIIAYFLYERYTNTRAYRIKKSIKNYNKHLKEQEQKIKKFDDDAKELLSDENKINNKKNTQQRRSNNSNCCI